MKNKLVLALAAVCLLAVAAQAELPLLGELEERGGVYYDPKTKKPYSGKVNPGDCSECGHGGSADMKNGKLHGKYYYSNEGGSIEGNFKDGKEHGEWIYNEEDSESIRIETYNDGLLQSNKTIQRTDIYKKELANCKGDNCAVIMYQLGSAYLHEANHSMAKQTFQQLLKKYPKSPYSQSANQMLENIEIASLPPEQQQAAKMQQDIDQYKKQLAECKGDDCAAIIYLLGTYYYVQQASLGDKADYSMAKQTLERLEKEYPNSSYSQSVKKTLAEIEIASLPPEQQQAARQAAKMQQDIDKQKKQLAECKGNNCARIIYDLGSAYYKQAQLGEGSDYSMAKQMLERLEKEHPNSMYSQNAKKMLMEIEIASLPPEQQQAARVQAAQQAALQAQAAQAAQAARNAQVIDLQKKQLAECKGDNCAVIMYQLGNNYYSQQSILGAKADYSTAKQMFERLLKEYPNSPYSSAAKQMLANIEIASLPPEQQQAARMKAAQQAQAERLQPYIDTYKKQLAECKGDNCAVIMYQLGSTYYQQANYSMAKQMFEQLLKEHPNSPYKQYVNQMLNTIENMQKKSQ
jgi:outer membrane protein assembly factor BamD (BamD/ComL family)